MVMSRLETGNCRLPLVIYSAGDIFEKDGQNNCCGFQVLACSIEPSAKITVSGSLLEKKSEIRKPGLLFLLNILTCLPSWFMTSHGRTPT